MQAFQRPLLKIASARLVEPSRRIQILLGPRQVGKTTLALQLAKSHDGPDHYASADDPILRDAAWLQAQWLAARALVPDAPAVGVLLVIDEVQKIERWSEVIKRLWDEEQRAGSGLKVVLLGSTALGLQSGLSESLAGRFELIRAPHWSFGEMRDGFGFSLDEFFFFGGYPGAAGMIKDERRWGAYIRDAILEPSLSRDVLLLNRIDKPALLRSVMRLACDYSGQILSYQKMTGQLIDAGNTTTIAHYLDLLAGAGLAQGLERYSPGKVRQRRSSPKLLALNTGLITASARLSIDQARSDPALWGRLVESAVGAHLVSDDTIETAYWRESAHEVDFVIEQGTAAMAIDLKSGRKRDSLPGMRRFGDRYPGVKQLLVGADGLPLEQFMTAPPGEFL